MPIFVTPVILALVILTALIFAGAGVLVKNRLRMNAGKSIDLIPLRLKPSMVDEKLPEKLRALNIPLTFEAAVGYLGMEILYFVIARARDAEKVAKRLEAQEAEDYGVYHHTGFHAGGYFKSDEPALIVDFKKLDFSKVKAVGEGAVFQMVLEKRGKQRFFANIRILASAPSQYRAKEILETLRAPIAGSFVDVKSDEFIGRLHAREFSEGERVQIEI